MRKMKRFADGGSDKYKAKYDRKVADIESDYEKAKARKTGRAAEVAKAKYEQRMADAKDDLAKWTKSDRTETRAAEKAAERELTMTRRFGGRKIAALEGADKPLGQARPSDAELTKLTSDASQRFKDSGSFKAAFAAARKDPNKPKTFTWRGASYTTELASEKPKAAARSTGSGRGASTTAGRGTTTTAGRGAPTTAGRGTPSTAGRGTSTGARVAAAVAGGPSVVATEAGARSGARAALSGDKPVVRTAPGYKPNYNDKRAAELRAGTAADRKLENAPAGTPGAAAARLKKYLGITSARESTASSLERSGQRQRWRDVEAQGAKDAAAARNAGKLEELRKAAEAPGASGYAKSRYRYAKESGMVGNAKGGSIKGYAKGGKIDGCAVRGKTKAGRK